MKNINKLNLLWQTTSDVEWLVNTSVMMGISPLEITLAITKCIEPLMHLVDDDYNNALFIATTDYCNHVISKDKLTIIHKKNYRNTYIEHANRYIIRAIYRNASFVLNYSYTVTPIEYAIESINCINIAFEMKNDQKVSVANLYRKNISIDIIKNQKQL